MTTSLFAVGDLVQVQHENPQPIWKIVRFHCRRISDGKGTFVEGAVMRLHLSHEPEDRAPQQWQPFHHLAHLPAVDRLAEVINE